jgi:serpin B
MKRWLLLPPLLFAACSSPGSTQPGPGMTARELPGHTARQELAAAAAANRDFGLALYKRLAAKPGNVFISPISLAGAFGPVTAGARGETRAAIGKVLRFPSDDAALHRGLGGLLRGLESDKDGARVAIANGLWLMKGIPVKPAFVTVAKDSYDAEVESLDFRDGAAAAKRINAWVGRKTNERIRNLIAPDSLDEMTRAVVTNAVHFLGDWTVPFNASLTRPQPFHLESGKTRDVPMMYSRRAHRLVDAGPMQLLDLPYKGGRMTMVAVLPKRRLGLSAMESGLTGAQVGEWLKRLDSAEPADAIVYLPKVKVEAGYELNEPLKAMGMAIAFDPKRANFRGIVEREQLFISQVVHKTFLRIDEKGTEAGAATGIEIEAESAPPEFRADHPFLVLIRDKQTGAVLFIGRIADPAAS